jgi:glyoxylase-like metal-dependent hydrolase (beta-lactamase superfamily II)
MNRADADRRAFLASCVFGAGAWVLARRGAACEPPPGMVHEWAPTRVPHVRVACGAGGNMVLIVGAGGASAGAGVLVDTCAVPLGPQVRRECEALAHKVGLVVSTHHHPEVTGGLRAFTTDTRVVGHEHARARVTAQMHRYISQVKEFLFRADETGDAGAREAVRRDWHALHARIGSLQPDEFAPTDPLAEASHEWTVDGRRVVVLDVPRAIAPMKGAHTDTDLVVLLPDDDVVIAGGLLCHGRHAVIDRDAGSSVEGWLAALDVLESKCTDRTLVIPGEGEPGGRELIAWERAYLTGMRDAVRRAMGEGATRQQVRALRPAVGVASADPSESRLLGSLDSLYDELLPPQTPNSGGSGKK